MTLPTRQRARSAADKQQRRAQILATALVMWDAHSVASFTMAEVAARSGLAKGTLYLYFETKEELLLALLEGLLVGWFDALDGGLAEAGLCEIAQIASLLSAVLSERPALTRLLPLAATIFEHNIPLESARAYKELLLDRSARSAAGLERCLSFLQPGEGLWLLLQLYALIVGLGQMADPAPMARRLLDEERLAPLRVAFDPAFHRSITTLLHGMQAETRLARCGLATHHGENLAGDEA